MVCDWFFTTWDISPNGSLHLSKDQKSFRSSCESCFVYVYLLTFRYSSYQDARSSDDGKEIIIDQQQDCIIQTTAAISKAEISFKRKFDTCDENDFPFHDGTMYIFWMRGREPLPLHLNFKKPKLLKSDHGVSSLQLLHDDSYSIPEK